MREGMGTRDEGSRRIVLCADDFGMNTAVDAGILALARSARLTGASCLVDGPSFAAGAGELAASGLQLGLHLNFTESFGQAGPCLPLRSLIAAAYSARLDQGALRASLQRQLQLFHDHIGRSPDYIDGHQHVHQLPGIRTCVLQTLATFPEPRRPWLRDTSRPRVLGLPLRLQLKARVIAALGASALRREAQALGIRMNEGFLGVYDFQGGMSAYLRWMRAWLLACRDGDVLMCHPALGADADDPLSAQRQAEFQVLNGSALAELLVRHGVAILAPRALQSAS